MKLFHEFEQNYLHYLQTKNLSTKIVREYLDELSEFKSHDFVHHPINCYQLLKRTAKYLPSLLKILPNQQLMKYLPYLTKSFNAAKFGLADIQEYYDLEPLQMANGLVQFKNQLFKSNFSLSIEDMVLIADAAKEENNLDGQVKWLNEAQLRSKRKRRKIKNLK